jgi:hypothetical protein
VHWVFLEWWLLLDFWKNCMLLHNPMLHNHVDRTPHSPPSSAIWIKTTPYFSTISFNINANLCQGLPSGTLTFDFLVKFIGTFHFVYACCTSYSSYLQFNHLCTTQSTPIIQIHITICPESSSYFAHSYIRTPSSNYCSQTSSICFGIIHCLVFIHQAVFKVKIETLCFRDRNSANT